MARQPQCHRCLGFIRESIHIEDQLKSNWHHLSNTDAVSCKDVGIEAVYGANYIAPKTTNIELYVSFLPARIIENRDMSWILAQLYRLMYEQNRRTG